MLARHTAFYFLANAFSAVFGLVNVVVFTRFFAADAFGDYLLGFAFATVFATFLSSAIKLSILRDQARGDGTDVRPSALAALLLCCLALPLGYVAARLANLAPAIAIASIGLTIAIAVYDTSQEVLRAEQKAVSVMRGTVVRAVLVSGLGITFTLFGRTGALLLASMSIAYLLATLTFWRAAWGAARPRFEAARLFEIVRSGFPLTISLSLQPSPASETSAFSKISAFVSRLAGVFPLLLSASSRSRSSTLSRTTYLFTATSRAAIFASVHQGEDASESHKGFNLAEAGD